MKKVVVVFMLVVSFAAGVFGQGKTVTYAGNLGGKYPIHMVLNIYQTAPSSYDPLRVEGYYYYDKYQKKMDLWGEYANGRLTVAYRDEDGDAEISVSDEEFLGTASTNGAFYPNSNFKGMWQNNLTNKQLNFNLKLISTKNR